MRVLDSISSLATVFQPANEFRCSQSPLLSTSAALNRCQSVADCGEKMVSMTEPVDAVVNAVAEAQAVLLDYGERRGRNRSAQLTLDRLIAIFEDPAVLAAMEALGHAPLRVATRLRVIEGGAPDKSE
jgi:hypothetical protein